LQSRNFKLKYYPLNIKLTTSAAQQRRTHTLYLKKHPQYILPIMPIEQQQRWKEQKRLQTVYHTFS
jgi:hypothetical protein